MTTLPKITRQGTEHGVRTFILVANGETFTDLPFPTATAAAKLFAAGDDHGALEAIYGPEDDAPTCSICDGAGHGYVGGPPCPLEVCDYSGEPWWAL